MTLHINYPKNLNHQPNLSNIFMLHLSSNYSMKVCVLFCTLSFQTAQQTADGGLSYETVLNGNSIYHVTKPWSDGLWVGMGTSEMRSF